MSFSDELRKDAPVLTTTSGAYNAIFGGKLWVQATTEASLFGALPKKPYEKAGYRAITVLSDTSGGGISQGGAIPATTKPTFTEITVGLKEMSISFDMSARELAVQGKDDVPTWEELRRVQGETFNKLINIALLKDMDTTAPGSETAFETIDRIVSNTAADVTGCGATVGDEDYAGFDRSATTGVFDGYVSHNGSAGSETDRTVTLSLIDGLEPNVRPYWAKPWANDNKIYVTGFDTLYRWSQLLQPNQRFGTERYKTSVNGIETVGNNEAGFVCSTYNSIPVIASGNVVKDTISRVYLLDLDNLWLAIAKPTMYMETEEYQYIDKFVREGVFYIMGETVCTLPAAHAKLRGLK